jgi:hypothetical protein
VDKTTYELKAEVETALVLPKTMQTETQLMPMGPAQVPMYVVYGRTDDDRKVWCATFIDSDEAMSWVQASKVFGRAVKGAVIADQKPAEAANDGTGTDSGEPAQKPN